MWREKRSSFLLRIRFLRFFLKKLKINQGGLTPTRLFWKLHLIIVIFRRICLCLPGFFYFLFFIFYFLFFIFYFLFFIFYFLFFIFYFLFFIFYFLFFIFYFFFYFFYFIFFFFFFFFLWAQISSV